jgi:hypothetical protein
MRKKKIFEKKLCILIDFKIKLNSINKNKLLETIKKSTYLNMMNSNSLKFYIEIISSN